MVRGRSSKVAGTWLRPYDGQTDELVGTNKQSDTKRNTHGSMNRSETDRYMERSEPCDNRQEARAATLTHQPPQHGPHMHLAGSSRHRQGPGPGCTLGRSGDVYSWLCSFVLPRYESQPGASSRENE